MIKRLISGVVMLCILFPLVLIDNTVCRILYSILVIFLSTVGCYEYMKAASDKMPRLKKFKYVLPVLAGLIGVLTCNATNLSNAGDHSAQLYPLLLYLLSVVGINIAMLFVKDSDAQDVQTCSFCLLYTGLMLGYAFSIRYLEPFNINKLGIEINGVNAFLYVYLVVLITDTFAYLFGIKFGKRKLCPSISPKKSVEGAIAGLVGGAVIGTVGAFLFGMISFEGNIVLRVIVMLLFSALLSMIVQLGDLVESKLKRSFDVKDFGNIMPGHGGILDRFDSLIFSGLVYYIIVMIMEVIILG